MEIIYLLIPLAIILAGLITAGFLWAIKFGQMEDLDSPAYRVLFDEDKPDISRKPD